VKKRAEKVQVALDSVLQERKAVVSATASTTLASKEFLSKDEACLLVGISRCTLQRMIKKGTIAAGKFGSRIIVRRADLDKLFS
jgi:excisionase family DNA binding protein